MRLMNLIIAFVLAFAPVMAMGQAGRTVEGTYFPGMIGDSNTIGVNPGAEKNALGWATYSNTALDYPVSGTGGTASGVSFNRTTIDVIDGAASFNFTKGSSNAQGKGFSYDFTIPLSASYSGKTREVNFSYKENSGGTYTGSDVGIYVYDVTNNKILATNVLAKPANTTTIVPYTLSWLPTPGVTSYRLIGHIKTTNTTTWVLRFDNFQEGISRNIGTLQSFTAGTIFYVRSATCPTGSELADGGTTTSADLIAALGSSTRPDLRGIFIRGAGTNATGATSGFAGTLGTSTADSLKSHNHLTGINGENSISGRYGYGSTWNNGSSSRISSTGGTAYDTYTSSTGGTETAPANLALTACIQAVGSNQVINPALGNGYMGKSWLTTGVIRYDFGSGAAASTTRTLVTNASWASGYTLLGNAVNDASSNYQVSGYQPVGDYEVDIGMLLVAQSTAGNGAECVWDVWDGTRVVASSAPVASSQAGANRQDMSSFRGVFSVAAAGVKTYQLRVSKVGGGTTAICTSFTDGTAGAGTALGSFVIRPLSQSAILPVMANQVVTESQGVDKIVRIKFGGATAYTTNCTSNPCTVWDSNLTTTPTVSWNSTGNYTITWASGTFSKQPACSCSAINMSTSAAYCASNGPSSLTGWGIITANINTAGTAANTGVDIVCVGPK